MGRLRQWSKMQFQRVVGKLVFLPLGIGDWRREVGDGTGSSLVASVLNWIARTFPEAPPALWLEDEEGQETQIRQHDMLKLLRKPNDFYTGIILWMATVVDWVVDGNAYWLKIRDGGGKVIQLWWVPYHMMKPVGDEGEFVTHYEYTPNAEPFQIPVADVVHFRFGADTDDPKRGYSQLKSILREVFTDDEAANFTASLLKNMGVPGIVVSPEKGVALKPDDADAMKTYIKDKFSGQKRGEPMVMTGATKVEQFGFSPEQLLLRELRRIPEERVSAATGIPAIVVGFGAGLERSTFTNMGEARAAAYEAGLIPMQRIMAEEILFQLLVDFEDDVYAFRFGFDLKKVRVLQEDETQLARRWDVMIRGGWVKVREGRQALGLPVRPGDDVYLRQINVVPVENGNDLPPAPAQPPPSSGLNGHAPELAAALADELERRALVAA